MTSNEASDDRNFLNDETPMSRCLSAYVTSMPEMKDGHVLDIGCGQGAQLIKCMRAGALTADGIDILSSAIEVSKALCEQFGDRARIRQILLTIRTHCVRCLLNERPELVFCFATRIRYRFLRLFLTDILPELTVVT